MKLKTLLNILSPVTNLLNTGKNPHQEALPYLNQVPEFGKQAYQPFIEQGKTAAEGLPDYAQMSQDPAGFLNMLMEQYEPSAGYQRQLDNAMKAIGSVGAAGGVAGTPMHSEYAGELANSLLGEDMQRFLQNVLGIQGTGAGGLETQVERGYNASSGLADYMGNAYGNLAQSAFEGRAGQNQARQAMMANLLKLATTAAGGYFGGPAGAAAGGSLADIFGGSGGGTGGGGGYQPGAQSYGVPGGGQEALFGRYGTQKTPYRSLTSIRGA